MSAKDQTLPKSDVRVFPLDNDQIADTTAMNSRRLMSGSRAQDSNIVAGQTWELEVAL
jgi:hypothetical protein